MDQKNGNQPKQHFHKLFQLYERNPNRWAKLAYLFKCQKILFRPLLHRSRNFTRIFLNINPPTRWVLSIWVISSTNTFFGSPLLTTLWLYVSSYGVSCPLSALENIMNTLATSKKSKVFNILMMPSSMFMRVGPFLFVGHLILFLEGIILYKFSRGTKTFFKDTPTQ